MRRQRSLPGLWALAFAFLTLGPAAANSQTTQPESTADAPTQLGTPAAIPIIPWQDAGAHIGREVYIVGKIVRTGTSRTGHVFLNFDQDYRHSTTVFIRRQDVKSFPAPPEDTYRDKVIRIRGFPYEKNGQPNIALASPDHVIILPDAAAIPATTSRPAALATQPAPRDTVTVGSYNVLNLFDAADDPYTADESTGPKPQQQVELLAKSIRALDADVLALIEVENRGVLQQFVDVYLSDMGYEVVLYEGNDPRGIDTAVLSRLPVGSVTSHRHLRFNNTEGHPIRFQRDLLEVRLEPPAGAPFDLFVVHLKSKGGDDGDGREIRLPESQTIRSILDAKLKTDPHSAFLIAGDFNDTLDSESVKAIVGSGATGVMSFVDDIPAELRITYNQRPYRGMIDFIFASPALAQRYVPNSYSIPRDGSPSTTGSDHNPVLAKFRLK